LRGESFDKESSQSGEEMNLKGATGAIFSSEDIVLALVALRLDRHFRHAHEVVRRHYLERYHEQYSTILPQFLATEHFKSLEGYITR
jgi:hypothetical protein